MQTKKSLATEIIFYLSIITLTLLSMRLSVFFASDIDRVHVISFTSAFVVAALIRYGFKVVPSIIVALLYHYIFISERPLHIAATFSFFLPLSNYVFVTLYQLINTRLNHEDYMLRASFYTVVIGLFLPLINTLSMIFISDILGYPFIGRPNFLSYSVLAGAISQLLLTPLFYLLFGFIDPKLRKKYLEIDLSMKKDTVKTRLHYLWGFSCTVLLISMFFTTNLMTINTLSLLIVPIVALGVGRFGIIEPYIITIISCLLATHNGISSINSQLISEETFYSMITVLFSIVTFILLLIVQAIKNHYTLENTIQKERLDPYTGLLSMSQFKSDIENNHGNTVLFIDIHEMVNKLKALGFEGKIHLIKRLAKFITLLMKNKGKAYLPPFSQGLLYVFPTGNTSKLDINTLVNSLHLFKFKWKHETFNLISHKIICTKLDKHVDINLTLSSLCTPSETHTHGSDINWITIDENEDHKLNKLSRIQMAFKENKFVLVCQPYLNLNNSTAPAYFEVLIRLSQDKKSKANLTPAEFFPSITEFGLETELDRWVIKETFKTLNEFISHWDSLGRCSINLTAQALNTHSIAPFILTEAKKYNIDLSKICFEITESSAINNEEAAFTTIQKLREYGCKIALDDFGTGYASFDYLRRLPIDILKIDGSFVRNITQSNIDNTIVKAMSQVAQGMKLATVAEFVESEEHIPLLREAGIDYAQGYAIAKPLSLIDYLKEHHSNLKVIPSKEK